VRTRQARWDFVALQERDIDNANRRRFLDVQVCVFSVFGMIVSGGVLDRVDVPRQQRSDPRSRVGNGPIDDAIPGRRFTPVAFVTFKDDFGATLPGYELVWTRPNQTIATIQFYGGLAFWRRT